MRPFRPCYFGKESGGTSTTCALPFGAGYSITVSFVYVILFCVSVVVNVSALSKRWKVQDRVNSLPSQSAPLVKNMSYVHPDISHLGGLAACDIERRYRPSVLRECDSGVVVWDVFCRDLAPSRAGSAQDCPVVLVAVG